MKKGYTRYVVVEKRKNEIEVERKRERVSKTEDRAKGERITKKVRESTNNAACKISSYILYIISTIRRFSSIVNVLFFTLLYSSLHINDTSLLLHIII